MSYAQDIIETLANETCSCLQARKLDLDKLSGDQIENEFVTCFFANYGKHTDEVQKVEKLDFGNEEQMTKFGEKVALKMITVCPDIIMAMGRADDGNNVAAIEPQFLSVDGEITEIKTDGFVTIVVKDKNARLYNFALLNYFETASLYTNGKLKKNDKVKVSYSEMELYDTKAKEFRYYKVITGLEKK